MNTTYVKTLLITTLCHKSTHRYWSKDNLPDYFVSSIGKNESFIYKVDVIKLLVLWQIFEAILDFSVSYSELTPWATWIFQLVENVSAKLLKQPAKKDIIPFLYN